MEGVGPPHWAPVGEEGEGHGVVVMCVCVCVLTYGPIHLCLLSLPPPLPPPSFVRCNTGVQVAWIGTDRQFATFKTGPQIQRLNSLSIVSLYFTVFNYLEGIVSRD